MQGKLFLPIVICASVACVGVRVCAALSNTNKNAIEEIILVDEDDEDDEEYVHVDGNDSSVKSNKKGSESSSQTWTRTVQTDAMEEMYTLEADKPEKWSDLFPEFWKQKVMPRDSKQWLRSIDILKPPRDHIVHLRVYDMTRPTASEFCTFNPKRDNVAMSFEQKSKKVAKAQNPRQCGPYETDSSSWHGTLSLSRIYRTQQTYRRQNVQRVHGSGTGRDAVFLSNVIPGQLLTQATDDGLATGEHLCNTTHCRQTLTVTNLADAGQINHPIGYGAANSTSDPVGNILLTQHLWINEDGTPNFHHDRPPSKVCEVDCNRTTRCSTPATETLRILPDWINSGRSHARDNIEYDPLRHSYIVYVTVRVFHTVRQPLSLYKDSVENWKALAATDSISSHSIGKLDPNEARTRQLVRYNTTCFRLPHALVAELQTPVPFT